MDKVPSTRKGRGRWTQEPNDGIFVPEFVFGQNKNGKFAT